jgi:hypothetical protein
MDGGRPFKGRAAIRTWFEGLKQSWGEQDAVFLKDVFEAGDKVVIRPRWEVRGRTSGIDTQLEFTSVNTIKGGRILRQQHYFEDAEALEAVGLAE